MTPHQPIHEINIFHTFDSAFWGVWGTSRGSFWSPGAHFGCMGSRIKPQKHKHVAPAGPDLPAKTSCKKTTTHDLAIEITREYLVSQADYSSTLSSMALGVGWDQKSLAIANMGSVRDFIRNNYWLFFDDQHVWLDKYTDTNVTAKVVIAKHRGTLPSSEAACE